jgi:acid stress chaperone HdeA
MYRLTDSLSFDRQGNVMRKILLGVVMAGLGLSQIAFAQSPMKVQPGKMKCEDFVALDDNYKPALVYWAAGVVDECKKTPKTSFMGKVKQLARSGRFNVVDKDDHH